MAETLITLTIIGVIATLTVPNLITKYKKHVWVTQLQKNYAILKNALAQGEHEHGSLVDEPITQPNTRAKSAHILNKYFIPYLKVEKDCTKDANNNNCTSVNRYLLSPNMGSLGMFNPKTVSVMASFVLSDGTLVSYYYPYGIIVDLNGDGKPNIMGRDVFMYILSLRTHTEFAKQIKGSGLFPWGIGYTIDKLKTGTDGCGFKDVNSTVGAKCSALIFLQEKMDY